MKLIGILNPSIKMLVADCSGRLADVILEAIKMKKIIEEKRIARRRIIIIIK